MPRRRLPLLRALLWILLLAGLGWAGWQVKLFLERPPMVEVVEARSETVTRVLAVTGRIRPRLENRIVPLVSGRLVGLTREEGEAVRRGELLARIDDRAARAELAQGEAEIARESTRLAQLSKDLERADNLAREELIAADRVEEARLAVAESRRLLERLRQGARELTVRLDDYELRSPLDGYVLARPVDPGQVVGPQDVLYELASGESAEIEVEVDEQYLPELTLGMAATAAPLAGRRGPWRAEVSYIGKRIDRLSGAVIVRLAFLDEPPELPAGLSLDVNLTVEEHPAALTVPRAAVGGLGGEPWVLRVRAGRTERVPVRVIDWPAPRLVVLDGIAAGDLLVPEPKQAAVGIEVRTRSAS